MVIAHDDTVRPESTHLGHTDGLPPKARGGPQARGRSHRGERARCAHYILPKVQPDVIALGYDQEHAERSIRERLDELGYSGIDVTALLA